MANNVGVNVTRTTVGPLAFGDDPGDSIFMIATAERGLSDTVHLVTSYARYRQIFGGADGTPYTAATEIAEADEIAQLLYEGRARKRLYVVRVVDSAAVQAYVDLEDRDGTPEDTIRVHAKGEGAWANAYEITIADGTAANTFKITVKATAGGTVLETFDNLIVNDQSIDLVGDQSDYIYLENLNSTHAAPDNRPATGDFLLGADQAGVNGNNPLAADVVGTDDGLGTKTGLKAFRDTKYGRGFTIAPGLDADATVRTEMDAHVDSYYRVPLFGCPSGLTPTTVQDDVSSEDLLAGYYYPAAKVTDPVTLNTKTISQVGSVLRDWFDFIADSQWGQHPAGPSFKVNGRIETQSNGAPLIDATVAELLIAKGINPIYDKGRGNRVWGARTLSNDPKWSSLHAVWAYCVVASRLQETLELKVFGDASATTFFKDIEEGARIMMADLNDRLGLFHGTTPASGEAEDPDVHAFAVVCNESLLSPADIANNRIRVKAWFKDSLTAETIDVEVAKRNVA